MNYYYRFGTNYYHQAFELTTAHKQKNGIEWEEARRKNQKKKKNKNTRTLNKMWNFVTISIEYRKSAFNKQCQCRCHYSLAKNWYNPVCGLHYKIQKRYHLYLRNIFNTIRHSTFDNRKEKEKEKWKTSVTVHSKRLFHSIRWHVIFGIMLNENKNENRTSFWEKDEK